MYSETVSFSTYFFKTPQEPHNQLSLKNITPTSQFVITTKGETLDICQLRNSVYVLWSAVEVPRFNFHDFPIKKSFIQRKQERIEWIL